MSYRKIEGLVWARQLEKKPSFIPKGRPRGAKAAGIAYQRALGRALPAGGLDGPWFEFQDKNGLGVCQPDFLLVFDQLVVILEAKYSWTAEAFVQIELLYAPVVKMALKKPVFGLQVCKRMLPGALQGCSIVSSLGNGLILANNGRRVALHWLENTPILLRPTQDQIFAITQKDKTHEGEFRAANSASGKNAEQAAGTRGERINA